jgi:hypothetical protein
MTGRLELLDVRERPGDVPERPRRRADRREPGQRPDTVRAVRDAKLLPATKAADAALHELSDIEEKSVAEIAADAQTPT